MSKGRLVIISGPSGVGKDTIMHAFLDKHPNWQRPVSVTSRPRRPGEKHGHDYFFVSREEFENRAANGEFLEWVEYTGHLYGTLQAPMEKLINEGHNILLRIDIQGALHIKNIMQRVITICLLPDEEEALEQRFRNRATDSEEFLKARMKLAKKELAYKEKFDHLVINPHGRPEAALSEIEKIAGV